MDSSRHLWLALNRKRIRASLSCLFLDGGPGFLVSPGGGAATLRNVVDLITCYYHVLSSLSQDAVHLVRHVLHEETGSDSCNNLRISLMASYSFS